MDRQGAYDDLLAADGDLDDGIRNLFSAAETFDRDNLGAGTLAMLFPSGGFGTIIEHNYLAARQTLGRGISERLFPKANRYQSNEAAPSSPVPALS